MMLKYDLLNKLSAITEPSSGAIVVRVQLVTWLKNCIKFKLACRRWKHSIMSAFGLLTTFALLLISAPMTFATTTPASSADTVYNILDYGATKPSENGSNY